jgi:hypothetical protein
MRTVFPNRPALSMRGRRAPNPTEPCAVLAAVKTTSRRYAMAATQPVSTATARDTLVLRQVGTEKQPLRPNRETKLRVHRTGRGDPLSVVGVDRITSVAVEGHKPGQEVYLQRPAGRGRANGHVDEALRTGPGTSYHAG